MIANYSEICSAQKDGVPQLWKSEVWALQFADFIFEFVGDGSEPSVIEVHPPFNDYTDMNGFIKAYASFETKIKDRFPNVEILIENRCGSVYHGGKFILSKDFMLKTLDHIKVFEDGTLLVVSLDGTEMECKNEEE